MNKLFNNTEVAFKLKSDKALKNAYFLFKSLRYKKLVKVGTWAVKVAFKLKLPIEFMVKKALFNQFCGGVTKEDCLPTIKNMHQENVFTILDYSVEGKKNETQFEESKKKIIDSITFAKDRKEIPFCVFKPTAVGHHLIYQKMAEQKQLSEDEAKSCLRIKERFHSICDYAYKSEIPVLIDAEESWIQDPVDTLVMELMESYNQKKAWIYNTLQMYRHDRFNYLEKITEIAQKKNFKLGLKIVRGAYMEKERTRAEEYKYPSPICATKKITDEMYNKALHFCVANSETIGLYAGTHNEASCYLLMDLMLKNNRKPNDGNIHFGQLYGMSDYITYNIACQGFNASKYVPYGPVKEVIPYLFRRAEENSSVEEQSGRELELIQKEKKRRGV